MDYFPLCCNTSKYKVYIIYAGSMILLVFLMSLAYDCWDYFSCSNWASSKKSDCFFLFLVPGISAPGSGVPAVPDRIVTHSDPNKTTPPMPQEKPPLQQQTPGVPQESTADVSTPVNHTDPIKHQLGFPRKLSDTLELKRIPRDLNNISKLNEHFQRFGTITNIQVQCHLRHYTNYRWITLSTG